MLVVGDSLAVGIAPYMPPRAVVDARVGRPLAEGLARLPRHRRHGVLLVSLGTNDDPRTVRVQAAVRRTLRFVGADGCVVWATLHGPMGYSRVNRALKREAKQRLRVTLVPWGEAVRKHPSWLAGDGVHATPTGYRHRASMYLRAMERCP